MRYTVVMTASTLTPIARDTKPQDKWLFLKKFFRHGTRIASVHPSSRTLSRAMVENIPYETATSIVELGAGTGPVTEEILKRMRPGCRLLAVENDTDFCKVLRERFPNAEVVEGNACRLAEILDAHGLATVDYVMSGLPTPTLSKEDQETLMRDVADRLTPGGGYIQLTEFPLIFLSYYKRYFKDVTFRFVARNLPPSGYYVCRDPKGVK